MSLHRLIPKGYVLEGFKVKENCTIYSSIYCPIDDVKERVQSGRIHLKTLIEHFREFGDREGITFLELTEDSLKNLPPFMVRNMGCFSQDNIERMVYSIKEINFSEKYMEAVEGFIEEILPELFETGFNSEIIIVRMTKNEEENVGKTVGKKEYSILYRKVFQ